MFKYKLYDATTKADMVLDNFTDGSFAVPVMKDDFFRLTDGTLCKSLCTEHWPWYSVLCYTPEEK